MNILYEPFPDSITAGGKQYTVLTDFREWLRFADMLRDDSLSAEERAYLCGMWIEPEPDSVTEELLAALLSFYRADALNPPKPVDDDEASEITVPKPPVLDFSIDAAYILGDFRRFYGIDLLSAVHMHWWAFLSLLRALPDESCTMRRAGYRGVNLSDIPDKRQRARIAKIQREIALPFELDDEMIGAMMWNA